MGWLIDSSVWIAIERGRITMADVNVRTGSDIVHVSPVNVAEIQSGLELIADTGLKLRAARTLRRLLRLPQLRITQQTGVVYGRLFAALEQSGRSGDFRVNDLWLAAQCVQRDFTLLTANAKDFQDIPGLKLVAIAPL